MVMVIVTFQPVGKSFDPIKKIKLSLNMHSFSSHLITIVKLTIQYEQNERGLNTVAEE